MVPPPRSRRARNSNGKKKKKKNSSPNKRLSHTVDEEEEGLQVGAGASSSQGRKVQRVSRRRAADTQGGAEELCFFSVSDVGCVFVLSVACVVCVCDQDGVLGRGGCGL